MKSASALLAAVLCLTPICVVVGTLAAPAACAEDDAATERARKNAIKGLKSKIRKLAGSPWAHKPEKIAELFKHLEALAALGGKEAGVAAVEAVAHTDAGIRDAAFAIIEKEHDKALVKPLVALLEDKRFRRDADARRRTAHALSVVGDPGAVEPLAAMIRFDEDAEVVAEAADALAGFSTAKLPLRKIAVKRLVDLYSSTWNLKESVKTEPKDKKLRAEAQAKYKVYGKSLRHALQSLAGVQITRPHEWRKWWNENKKKKEWKRA